MSAVGPTSAAASTLPSTASMQVAPTAFLCSPADQDPVLENRPCALCELNLELDSGTVHVSQSKQLLPLQPLASL